jgi:DnaJ like chaperone protein
MAWIGKITGGILGYAAARLIGAVIGVVLGHQFDRGMAREPSRQGRRSGSRGGASVDRQRLLFESTFLVMGRLAKLDGRVSEAEIDAAREVMRHMRLNERQVRLAIDLFTAGKQPDYPIDEQIERFRRHCGDERHLLRTLIEALLDFVVARGGLTSAERDFLDTIAARLGVDRLELAGIEALLRARRGFMGGSAAQSRDTGLDGAYRALGIEHDATDEEVKKAYRRLMNEHHPDKIIARGLPETMLEKAKERTSEILAAYETIKDHRGLK